MRAFVIDTHPLIWYAAGQTRSLGQRALAACRAGGVRQVTIYVPSVVLAETYLLHRRGRIQVRGTFGQWRAELEAAVGSVVAGFDRDEVGYLSGTEVLRDPFDQMIVATARSLGLPLITKDRAIAESRLVEICW